MIGKVLMLVTYLHSLETINNSMYKGDSKICFIVSCIHYDKNNLTAGFVLKKNCYLINDSHAYISC